MIAYRISTLDFRIYPGTHVETIEVDAMNSGYVYFNKIHSMFFEPIAT